MKKIIILFLLTLFFISNVHAQSDISIVHGPFKTDLFTDGEIYFEKDKKSTINFILSHKNNNDTIKEVVDIYDIEGGSPKIETVFFYPVKNKINIFVIVSWEINHRGLGIYGTFYQIYAYYKNNEESLMLNKEISNSRELYGIEGTVDWKDSYFKYKTASDVKKYINKNF